VAGPLVPAQMEAGTKGSRPKARFLLVHATRILRPFIFSTLTGHLFSNVYPMRPRSTAPEYHPHGIAPRLMLVRLADDNTQGSSRRVNPCMLSGRIIATTIRFSPSLVEMLDWI
jgi:hypothetical protein